MFLEKVIIPQKIIYSTVKFDKYLKFSGTIRSVSGENSDCRLQSSPSATNFIGFRGNLSVDDVNFMKLGEII